MRNLFDPKEYKHVSTGKDYTVLKHRKGHQIRIAHNVLSPQHKTMLSALAKVGQENQTEGQKQEAQDANQYGKVIMKAEGGEVDKGPEYHSEMQQSHLKDAERWGSSPEYAHHAESSRNKAKYHGEMHRATLHGQSPEKAAHFKARAEKHKYAYGDTVQGNLSAVANNARGGDAATTPKSAPSSSSGASEHEEQWTTSQSKPYPGSWQDTHPAGKAEGGKVEKMAEGGITSAYDEGLPCLNPNCKSHGRPHANCRCYAGHAHGGHVSKLRYCAHGVPHQDGCEYSSDTLASGKGGVSEQGAQVRHGMNAKEEAKGRAAMERHNKPRMKFADAGIIPYGMRQEDLPPKDEAQTEQEIDQNEASMPPSNREQATTNRMNARMSPALRPGMPGFEESMHPQPINDTQNPPSSLEDMDEDGSQTNQAMYNKIHTPDNQGNAGQQAPASDDMEDELKQPPNPENMTKTPGLEAAPEGKDPQQHIMEETNAYQQDLANGHITPKTYNDLMYHNKDGSEKSTLGKIGSIFGLILSSAGAGLAHQPVMALQMMDNVIKNDLNAQIQSKQNAQNFYRLNQQMLLNDANVKHTLATAGLTDAERAKVQQGVDMQAAALSYNQMAQSGFKHMIDQVNKLPEGSPERAQAAQAAMMVGQAVQENSAKAAAMAAGGIKSLGLYGINPENKAQSPDEQAEQDFQNKMQAMKIAGGDTAKTAEDLKSRHLPGVPGFSTSPIPAGVEEKHRDMSILDNKVKDVIAYAQQHRGSIDPSVLKTARQKAEELTSFYNKSTDSLGLTQGRLDWLGEQIKKNPTSLIQQILGNNATLREIRDSNNTRHALMLKQVGFPVQVPQQQSQPQYKTDASGQKWMRGPNGEAIKVK